MKSCRIIISHYVIFEGDIIIYEGTEADDAYYSYDAMKHTVYMVELLIIQYKFPTNFQNMPRLKSGMKTDQAIKE